MKIVMISLLVILFAASGLLMGCVLGDNPFPYISGSVTVVDVADWTNLRLGVFYDSTGYFTADYDFGETDYVYRAVYSSADDGSIIQFTPDPACSSTFSQTSGTLGTFRIDFDPNGSMVGGDYYYPIAWIDSTANNQLDLTDDWIPDNILAEPLSELCRTPIYDGDYVVRFYNNSDYGYKFDAYGAAAQTLSDVDRTAFSFDMTPATGGW